MAQSARQSSPESTASPRYFIRLRHPSQMDALAPMATKASAYRSKSEANILIAQLRPQDIEKLNKAEVEVIPSTRYEPLQQQRRVRHHWTRNRSASPMSSLILRRARLGQ